MVSPGGFDPYFNQFLGQAMGAAFGAQGGQAYPGPISNLSGMLQMDMARGGGMAQVFPNPTYLQGSFGAGFGMSPPMLNGGIGFGSPNFGMNPGFMGQPGFFP